MELYWSPGRVRRGKDEMVGDAQEGVAVRRPALDIGHSNRASAPGLVDDVRPVGVGCPPPPWRRFGTFCRCLHPVRPRPPTRSAYSDTGLANGRSPCRNSRGEPQWLQLLPGLSGCCACSCSPSILPTFHGTGPYRGERTSQLGSRRWGDSSTSGLSTLMGAPLLKALMLSRTPV